MVSHAVVTRNWRANYNVRGHSGTPFLARVGCNSLRRWLAAVALTFICLTTSILAAAEVNKFRVTGFGTLGLSYESESDLGFLRDSNQAKNPGKDVSFYPDSILGAQLSYRFDEKWRATTQVVLAKFAEYDIHSATELAFLGVTPRPDFDIRAGRMAVDMFQLSDYRRVDYVNLWVRPPTELYAWILPTSIDGLDIAKGFLAGDTFFRLKAQYGETSPTLDSPDGRQQFPTEFNNFFVATATADFDVWRTRLSFALFKTADSSPGFVPALAGIGSIPGPVGTEAAELASALQDTSSQTVRYWQAAISYDDGTWLVDTEFARLSASTVLVPQGSAGYISVGRRFEKLTPYLIHSRFFPDEEPFVSTADWSVFPGAEGLRDAALGVLNGPLIDQKTISAGLRWDIAPKIALKMQWDRTYIDKQTYALWAFQAEKSQKSSTVNLYSFALNFIY